MIEPASVHAARSHGDKLSLELVAKWDALVEAATNLYEQVEMEESVGNCLPDRTPCLILGDLLRDLK